LCEQKTENREIPTPPFFIGVIIFLVYFMYKKLLTFKPVFLIIGLGGFVYLSAIGSEVLMQQLHLRGGQLHLLQVATEESLELLGTLLFLLAFMLYFRMRLVHPGPSQEHEEPSRIGNVL